MNCRQNGELYERQKIFNILDCGAKVCDKVQTEKIQHALDACFLAGGGTVVVPNGIFRTGGLRLRSNTELHKNSAAAIKTTTL